VTVIHRLLHRTTRVASLGIRFWDEVSARVVSDGLVVEVYADGEPERRAAAVPNRLGVFVLARLPGSTDPAFEFGNGDAAQWSQLQARSHVLEVSDRNGHFQPFTVDHPLPAKGVTVPPCLPAASSTTAVPVFSTPSRPVPEATAVVRANLSFAPASGDPVPAAWAVLEVHVAGQPPARGVADRDGRVAVIFPYPEPVTSAAPAMSPPETSGPSLWNQEWTVRLAAFYAHATPAPVIPDLCRMLDQPAAMLWTNARGTRPLPDQSLRYGRELIVRDLFLTTAGSPP
jgi:hypothetical protein